jgi:hypothetical protein
MSDQLVIAGAAYWCDVGDLLHEAIWRNNLNHSKEIRMDPSQLFVSCTVNGGIPLLFGAQRSMVCNLRLAFSAPVDSTDVEDALELAVHQNVTVNGTLQPDGVGDVPDMTFSTPDGGTTWDVGFVDPGDGSVQGGSIPDGVYDLTVQGAAPKVTTFPRMFGAVGGTSVSGSGSSLTVNNADKLAFNKAAAMLYYGIDDVPAQFDARYNQTWSW